tara:strand:- start:2405 stop:3043 length:639 start_codon:yes stop_codon:yes gene_type:complete
MYAIITDGSISKYVNHPKPLVIGDVQYPARIFSVWTASELASIGIIEITFDDSNKKDNRYYINTDQTYTYDADAGTVTATYGNAIAKAHADTTWTQDEIDDGDAPTGADTNTVKIRGLKYNFIQDIKITANNLLSQTDWYVIRKSEKNTAIPNNITTWRNGIRTKQAAMETLITNASNTAAIETLYKYVNTADEGDPIVMERPLGEFPELGS